MALTKDEDYARGGISEWHIFVTSDSDNRFVRWLNRKPTSTNINYRSQLRFGRTATHPRVCCLVARASSHVISRPSFSAFVLCHVCVSCSQGER